MKEITVTFENGGVFNGSANSFTLDNLITYYFSIDKNYRVQVNASTMVIELQEYQNTNGAWYGIDIITAVSVQEVQGGGSGGGNVTKEYLEENYYSKVQINQITERFYNKDETDERYVLKTGDTMTGALTITDGTWSTLFEAQTITQTAGNERYFQMYRGNLNCYQGTSINCYSGGYGTKSLTQITPNGYYIRDTEGGTIGYFAQENNHSTVALHMFYNGRVVMHTGAPATTEQYMQIQNSTFSLYNAGDAGHIAFNASVIHNGNTTVSAGYRLNGNGTNYMNGLTIRTGYYIQIGENTDYFTRIYKDGVFEFYNNQKAVELSISRGLELYGGRAIIAHNDYSITGKHTAYNWNGIITYNMSAGDEFNLFLNNNTLNFYCYRFLVYGNYAVELRSTSTDVSIHGPQGYVSANNTPKATNDQFLSLNFLNALNLFLQRMQDNIRAQSPAYQIVSAISFDKEEFGGGFSAGGGSSRGGGVGRRT